MVVSPTILRDDPRGVMIPPRTLRCCIDICHWLAYRCSFVTEIASLKENNISPSRQQLARTVGHISRTPAIA